MAPAGPDPWRCFVGLPLPGPHREALTRQAARLAGALASRITWTKPDNWHLTLRFLGDVDAAAVPALCSALAGVRFAPFSLRLGAAGGFPPAGGRGAPRTLWVGLECGAEQCIRLAADLDRALEPLGFEPGDRPLRPHVTLGRVRKAPSEVKAGEDKSGKGKSGGDDWAAALAGVDLGGLPEFVAERFTLWRSILGPGGPCYEPLAEFPAA